MSENLIVSFAPHIGKTVSTRRLMTDVVISLVPAVAAAGYYFRAPALILIATCVISAVATEWICNRLRKKPTSISDFSAVITGIILALSLPPKLPIWAAVIGSVFAIAIGKMVFGGLGANIFNPAMIGRAFLTACFGMLMTTWAVPATINAAMPKISSETSPDAITQATPLAWSKQAIKTKTGAELVNKQLEACFTGARGGCLGETSTIALLVGGIYLLARQTINFIIPAGVLLSAAVFAALGYLINPQAYVSPLLQITSGGIMLCAFFIATDPVTMPLTTTGRWIFAIGVGGMIMLIRMVGEYPEGVMYAVLLMNAVTPLIDRFCRFIPIGGRGNV
jgi:electron transport complex protein RnfD